MAISFVKGTSGGNASGPVTTTAFTGSTTTGNLIVVAVNAWGSSTSSVTDSKSNAYTQIGTEQVNGNNHLSYWYALNITGGASHTVTANRTTGSNFIVVVAQEISGADTVAPLDQTTGATGSSTTPDSGSTATTSQPNELVVGFEGNTVISTATPGSGLINQTTVSNGGSIEVSMASKVVGGIAGSYNATWTITSGAWTAGVATFRAKANPSFKSPILRPAIFKPGIAR